MFGGIGSPTNPFALTEYDYGFRGYSALDGKTARPVILAAERTIIVLAYGQSNAGNHLSGSYSPSNASKIDQLCIYNGGVYAATEPLLGASWVGPTYQSNIWVDFADRLIAGNKCDRVILVPFAIGASAIAQWAPGGFLNRRIDVACKWVIERSLLSATHVIAVQHQGESDAIAGTSQAAYTASQLAVIQTFRDNGLASPDVPIFICPVTGQGGASAAVIAAQAAVVDNVGVFSGPVSDDIANRYDGLHFDATGRATLASRLYSTAVSTLGL